MLLLLLLLLTAAVAAAAAASAITTAVVVIIVVCSHKYHNHNYFFISEKKPQHTTTMTPMSVIAALVVVMTTMTMSDVSGVPADYQAQRTALLQEEHNARLGGSGAALNADERVVDRLLMEEKRRLIEGARLNGSDFPVRHNFLNRTARAAMEATRAFRIIRQMPKGGFENDDDGGDDDDEEDGG